MTLLELVVGITIAGVAMAAGYGALATILDHRERVDTVSQASSVAASQRKLLKEWLEGAHLVVTGSGPAFQGLDGVYQDEPDDQLTLLTSGWPMPNAGEVIVRLFVDRDTATAEHGLVAAIRPVHGIETRIAEIEPRVTGLDLMYATRMLGRIEWLPSWVSSTVLPAGVELRVSSARTDTLHPLLRLSVSAVLGAGR